MNRIGTFFHTKKGLIVLYLLFLGAYMGASSGRLRTHSAYNHFVYLAESWLHGQLELTVSPPNENDWAKVDVLTLRDGRTMKGMYGKNGGPTDRFYPLKGPSETVNPDDIVSRTLIRYVSFPPFPAVLMVPFVAIWHLQFNDVLFTVIWAALNPVFLFLLLREFQRRGHSKRTAGDDLWLCIAFGLGSVYYYSSVIGQVWYTAHVVGISCVIGYAWASIDAARPAWAGLFIGLGYATRPSLGFMFPFFIWEAVRVSGGWSELRRTLRPTPGLFPRLFRFAIPAALVVTALLWHNAARFANPLVFGHEYLNISWQGRIQRWGLFNYHFLSRNLAAALVLLPRLQTKYPFVKVSEQGMSVLVTSPWLGYLLAPAEKTAVMRGLWWAVLATALPSFLYQNSGYIQFGYRFSLDYMIFCVLLLAAGNRPLSVVWKTLIVIAIGINLFGAITFDRHPQFTYGDTFFPHGGD